MLRLLKVFLSFKPRLFDPSFYSFLDVGRVHEEAVYESNMPIESCIESNRVGLPITPIPDWFFGTFAARIFWLVFLLKLYSVLTAWKTWFIKDLIYQQLFKFINFIIYCCLMSLLLAAVDMKWTTLFLNVLDVSSKI